MTALAASILSALLLLLVSVDVIEAVYLSDPVVEWTYQLPGSGTLSGRGVRRHNAVVPSYDGSKVFVTADDGSLHIIMPDNGSASIVVEAPSEQDMFTECRSGVGVSESGGILNFVAYAVIMSKLPTNQGSSNQILTNSTSRVMAVNPDGSTRWSVDVSGFVEGTPVIGVDPMTVYVSHNVPVSGGYQGILSVILDNGGSAVVAAEITIESRTVPFGALTIRSDSSTGVNKDILFWGESSIEGGTENPSLYFLTQSDVHTQNSGIGNESYILKSFSSLKSSLITKPTVSADLSGLWVGGGSSVVSGWTGSFGLASNLQSTNVVPAAWEVSVEQPEWNPSQPLPTSLVVSRDNSVVYLANAAFDLICLDAETGSTIWSSDGSGRSGYVVEPKLSEIDGESTMIYIIETRQGNVRQHDADDGDINWAVNCFDLSGVSGCQDSVEAEFSVSSNGNVLYFADIFGKITALKVASFPAPPPITSMPFTSSPPLSSPAPSQTPLSTSSPSASFSTMSPVEATLEPSTSSPGTPGTDSVQPSREDSAATTGPSVSSGELSPSSVQESSSAKNPTPPTNSDNGTTLLYSLIGTALVFVAIAFGFFALLFKRRRKARAEDEEVRKETEKQKKWRQQQRQVEEECRRREITILQEIGAVASTDPGTPKRSNKEVKQPEEATPSTLATIDESENEEVSLAPSAIEGENDVSSVCSGSSSVSLNSINPFGAIKGNGSVQSKQKPQDGESSDTLAYLPLALTASFDKVMGPLLFAGSSTGAPKPEPSAAQLASDRPWVHTDQRADDDSSIGSESLFIDEDGSVKSGTHSAFSAAVKSTTDDSTQPSQSDKSDPWMAIMSTIIAAEKQFFNPTLASSKRASRPVEPEKLQITPNDSQDESRAADKHSTPDYDVGEHLQGRSPQIIMANPQTPPQGSRPRELSNEDFETPPRTSNLSVSPLLKENLQIPLETTPQSGSRTTHDAFQTPPREFALSLNPAFNTIKTPTDITPQSNEPLTTIQSNNFESESKPTMEGLPTDDRPFDEETVRSQSNHQRSARYVIL